MSAPAIRVQATRRPDSEDRWHADPVWAALRRLGMEVGDERELSRPADATVVPYGMSEPPVDGLPGRVVVVLADCRWTAPEARWAWPRDAARDRRLRAAEANAIGWTERADVVVVFTEHARLLHRLVFPDAVEKVVVAPPPAGPAAPTGMPGPAVPPRYLLVAADHPDAPTARALQAVATLRFRGRDDLPPVVVVGADGASCVGPDSLPSWFGLAPGHDVVGVGDPSAVERAALFAAAEAIIAPDRWPGTCRALVDGLASGRPLACGRGEATRETLVRLSSHAKLFDPASPFAIADALAHLLEQPARFARVAAVAARRVRAYDGAAAAGRWAEILVPTHPPAPPVRRDRLGGRASRSAPLVALHVPRAPGLSGRRVLHELLAGFAELDDGPRIVLTGDEETVTGAEAVLSGVVAEVLAEDEDLSGVDLVHVPWPHNLPGPPATDTPLICTWHDFNFRHFTSLPAEVRDRAEELAPRWFGRSRFIVHSSRTIAEEMALLYPDYAARSVVIPLAVGALFMTPPDPGDRELLVQFGLPERYLLIPAWYEAHKNQDRVIRALESMPNPPNVVFTGADTDRLDGRAPGAIGLGVVDDLELRALYDGSSGVVVPSLYEAGSFPLMEAIARGVPVAASSIPAIREQAERLGSVPVIWLDPEDEADIARALASLWDGPGPDPNERRRARDAVARRTWRDVAADYASLYERTLAEAANRV